MIYLIHFEYEHFAQGWESAWTTVLIRDAKSFDDACRQIEESPEYKDPRYFNDLTI